MSLRGMVQRRGVSVSFSSTLMSVNESTHAMTPATSSIAGKVVHVDGDPERFRALSLTEGAAVTLLFVPDTAGQAPKDGMSVSWGGLLHTVRDVKPVGLTVPALAYSVVVAR